MELWSKTFPPSKYTALIQNSSNQVQCKKDGTAKNNKNENRNLFNKIWSDL